MGSDTGRRGRARRVCDICEQVGVDGAGDLVAAGEVDRAWVERSKVNAESLATLTVGAGSVWVTDPLGGTVTRIDPDPDPDEVVQRTILLDKWVGGIAFGEGAVWATNEIADKVYRIDPRTNRFRVVRGIAAPRGVAVGEGAAWVTTAGPFCRRGLPGLRLTRSST
jgi:streptogramin lyase